MLLEFLEAFFKAGLPVGIVTFLMVYWSLVNGYLTKSSDLDELKKELNNMAKKKKAKEQNGDFLHRKWVKFGGGFYGVVALMTYALIEVGEIRDFLSNFQGFFDFFRTVSFHMLIDFFIDSLMNFITAISWPAYWIVEINTNHIWVWFVAAYLGYLAGTRFAGVAVYRE